MLAAHVATLNRSPRNPIPNKENSRGTIRDFSFASKWLPIRATKTKTTILSLLLPPPLLYYQTKAVWQSESFTSAIVLQKRRSRLWVIESNKMPRCDWLQHCNFLAGIEILAFALQTTCKPCGFAAERPAIVAGPVLRVALGESWSVCRAPKQHSIAPHTGSLREPHSQERF